MAMDSIELAQRDTGLSPIPANVNRLSLDSSSNEAADVQHEQAEFSLPPADKGKQAWLFLAACWAVEALVFGFGFSFGVFQDYYSTHEPFSKASNIAVIGTTTMGTIYLGTPFVLALCRLFPRAARWFTLAGLFTASLAMALSSFCNNTSQLIGTQGFVFGLGGCFAYSPCVIYIDQWFAQRKGMAYGIVWSAAGFGGVVFPLILETLLDRLGFRTATRIWAVALFVASAPLAYFIKPRLPYSANTHIKPSQLHISRSFTFYQLANVVQATGYFLPGIYLPVYARATFGASPFLAALTIIIVNITTTAGLMIMGPLTDKLHVTTCIIISAIGGSAAVLLLWGFSYTLSILYVFCALYGLFAGCWTSTWPGVMKELSQPTESEGHMDSMAVYACLCIGRGVGNMISGPLSQALVAGLPWQNLAVAGYGSGYGRLIVYTGLTTLLSGTSFALKRLGWI